MAFLISFFIAVFMVISSPALAADRCADLFTKPSSAVVSDLEQAFDGFKKLGGDATLSVRGGNEVLLVSNSKATPLNRLAKRMKERFDYELVYDPEVLARKNALGLVRASDRLLFTSVASIRTGEIDSTVLHETRHVYENWLVSQALSRGDAIVLMQAVLEAGSNPTDSLGISGYPKSIHLDEFMTHTGDLIFAEADYRRRLRSDEPKGFPSAKKKANKLFRIADLAANLASLPSTVPAAESFSYFESKANPGNFAIFALDSGGSQIVISPAKEQGREILKVVVFSKSVNRILYGTSSKPEPRTDDLRFQFKIMNPRTVADFNAQLKDANRNRQLPLLAAKRSAITGPVPGFDRALVLIRDYLEDYHDLGVSVGELSELALKDLRRNDGEAYLKRLSAIRERLLPAYYPSPAHD